MKILLIVLLLILVLVLFLHSRVKASLRGRRKKIDVNPRDFGYASVDTVFYTEEGLKIKGWFLPAKNSNKTIILMHGFGMNRADVFKYTRFLKKENYNLFYFDFRALGESDGSVSSIGLLETKDLDAAIKFIYKTYPQETQEIALYGMSMGAAVCAYRASIDAKIKCIVLEATYYSFKDVVALWAWTRKHVPYFPILPLVLFFMKSILGVKNPEAFSPINSTPNIKCPTLMIHGEFDSLAPLLKAKKMFSLIKTPKEIYIVRGAVHNNCAEAGGATYEQNMTEFFRKNF